MPRDHAAECRAWNADHEHQVMAGDASFRAFSARMRAVNGETQIFPMQAAKYVSPEQIGYMAHPLPLVLQTIIHTVWSHNIGWGVEHWLLPRDVMPPPPDGSLFADGSEPHEWTDFAPGWLICQTCWLAAICPVCQPNWIDDPILCRLLQALCAAHQGGM
jgi:hypothetical protein